MTLAAGLAVIAAAQLVAPRGTPPLYDGVVVQDPYRYLAPGPGQGGTPTSFRSSPAIQGPTSPQVVAATTESPPQAQLIAEPDAFVLPPGAAALTVSIDPVAAPAPPPAAAIVGNVYRIAVADQSGTALPVSPGALPTLILRAPEGVLTATIWRFGGATWQELTTEPAGQPGMFITNVTGLGDFALIGSPGGGPPGIDPKLIVLGAVPALLTVVVLGALMWWRRRRPKAVPRAPGRGRPQPSTRRGGRRRGASR
jgi:hypothetical protein